MIKKILLIIFVLLLVSAMVFLFQSHEDYGNALPPDFPQDVPIIKGRITSSKKTIFEDGIGFVIDIDSEESFEQVIGFYNGQLGKDIFRISIGMEQNMATADVHVGEKIIVIEVFSKVNLTHVTMAVHGIE